MEMETSPFSDGTESGYRNQRVAERAYFKAQARGFRGGDPVDDWLTAERELIAQGDPQFADQ